MCTMGDGKFRTFIANFLQAAEGFSPCRGGDGSHRSCQLEEIENVYLRYGHSSMSQNPAQLDTGLIVASTRFHLG